jgi:hypothetical protein
VICVDARGIEHGVQLSAQSLYEAVAQALRVFREHELMRGGFEEKCRERRGEGDAGRGRAPGQDQ